MQDPNSVVAKFAELPEDIEIDEMQVRAILVLSSIADEEIVQSITLWLSMPGTPDGKTDERRPALAIQPRHKNSLMIVDSAIFTALLKAKVISPPFYWEGMRSVCKLLDFESAT
jgi:hypothetical protein